ncbi:hypothetical protein [Amycolatopsis sp. Hca4]|uniref:hypothetical protein n=1 Tax=Amycolatopsis sp. Hca4 TaxID=2742131 RepID=UPI0015914B3A|nr:hypothetical protein [Amycolatopsis sp. Hca4]QKV73902.1 hypothetical protein HUT10_09060 [Amycolatopsis sp. Hca4]
MTGALQPVGQLTADQVGAAVLAAGAAASLHNSQPWWFRCTPDAVELHADTTKADLATGLDQRELLLACGAALFNLRTTIRTLGVDPGVRFLPDRNRPNLLATVHPVTPRPAGSADRLLGAAVAQLHDDGRPAASASLPVALPAQLRQAAEAEQSWLATLPSAGRPVRTTTGASRGPASSSVSSPSFGLPGSSTQDKAGLLTAVGTFTDGVPARLQAGQALQRILLTAAAEGSTATPVPHALATTARRYELREHLGGALWPQAVLHVGPAIALPADVGRRDLTSLLTPPETDGLTVAALGRLRPGSGMPVRGR